MAAKPQRLSADVINNILHAMATRPDHAQPGGWAAAYAERCQRAKTVLKHVAEQKLSALRTQQLGAARRVRQAHILLQSENAARMKVEATVANLQAHVQAAEAAARMAAAEAAAATAELQATHEAAIKVLRAEAVARVARTDAKVAAAEARAAAAEDAAAEAAALLQQTHGAGTASTNVRASASTNTNTSASRKRSCMVAQTTRVAQTAQVATSSPIAREEAKEENTAATATPQTDIRRQERQHSLVHRPATHLQLRTKKRQRTER